MLDTENALDPADPPVNQPGGKAPQPQPINESDVAIEEEASAADPPESQSGGG